MTETKNHILELPSETLVQVFNWLDDIDDVLHFARCCRYVNSIFEYPGLRFGRVQINHCVLFMPVNRCLANENTFGK